MFDFDLELKKFKPAVGVEIGEDELFSDDVKDITDLVEELVSEREGKKASDRNIRNSRFSYPAYRLKETTV